MERTDYESLYKNYYYDSSDSYNYDSSYKDYTRELRYKNIPNYDPNQKYYSSDWIRFENMLERKKIKIMKSRGRMMGWFLGDSSPKDDIQYTFDEYLRKKQEIPDNQKRINEKLKRDKEEAERLKREEIERKKQAEIDAKRKAEEERDRRIEEKRQRARDRQLAEQKADEEERDRRIEEKRQRARDRQLAEEEKRKSQLAKQQRQEFELKEQKRKEETRRQLDLERKKSEEKIRKQKQAEQQKKNDIIQRENIVVIKSRYLVFLKFWATTKFLTPIIIAWQK